MKQYIQNLLPRLQQFSKSLDKKEHFVDKPWVLIDEAGDRHQYIFERNGNLIMSFNGQVIQGSWRYIAASNGLLINRRVDELLLKSAFVDNGIMLLKMDNYVSSMPLVFANEAVIEDLDVERYLTSLIVQKLNLKTLTILGRIYYYSDPDNLGINRNTVFYDEKFKKTSNSFNIPTSNGEYTVQNGVMAGFLYITHLDTDQGRIRLSSGNSILSVGDAVFKENMKAPNGKYILRNESIFKSLDVYNGTVSFLERHKTYGLHMLLGFLILIIVTVYLLVKFSPEPPIVNINPTDSSNLPLQTNGLQESADDTTSTPIIENTTSKDIRPGEGSELEVLPDSVIEDYKKVDIDINLTDNEDYSKVDKTASFPGGIDAWRRYLERNLNANVAADDGAPVGSYSVKLMFKVDEEGIISNVQSLETPKACPNCGREAERVIRRSPNWEPAVQNGEHVAYYAVQYVTFEVTDE